MTYMSEAWTDDVAVATKFASLVQCWLSWITVSQSLWNVMYLLAREDRPSREPVSLWHPQWRMVTGHLAGWVGNGYLPLLLLGHSLRAAEAGGEGRPPQAAPRPLLPTLPQLHWTMVCLKLNSLAVLCLRKVFFETIRVKRAICSKSYFDLNTSYQEYNIN